ncbi:serine hydrolase [Arsukibacterium sp.]|uniref:serine hydrolase n=1 Tax=Arsukibacterium sp. TaxID=1977258 RepID=UPI002FDB862C
MSTHLLQLARYIFLIGLFIGFNQAHAWQARHNITAATFTQLDAENRNKGYQLSYLNGHNVNGQARYNAIWRKMPANVTRVAFHQLTDAGYQQRVNSLQAQGFRPVMVNPFAVGNQQIFTAIFERKPQAPAWYARHHLTSAQYQQEYDTQKDRGYRLLHVSGYNRSGEARYAAIWQRDSGPTIRASHGISAATYQSQVNNYRRAGFAPVLVDVFHLNGQDYYSAIWHNSGPRWSARHDIAGNDYQQVFNDHRFEGFYPTVVVGYGNGRTLSHAAIFNNTAWHSPSLSQLNSRIESFRQLNNLSGLSIAITMDERLVYAKGFGLRDPLTNANMNSNTLGRIASNSKTLTGAAASRLIDENRLDPQARVFGPNGLLNHLYTLPVCNALDFACHLNRSRILNIRVLDVLEHSMGGWSNQSAVEACAPMIHLGYGWNICAQDTVNMAAAGRNQFTNFVVNNIRLMQNPGGAMNYSNVGYNIAEQLIEVASGQSYEGYMMQRFVNPAGSDCRLAQANNVLFDNEIAYAPGLAYIMNHRRMAGHGGWVCSAAGYLRLMTRLDGGNKRPDLLSANAFTNIFTNSQRSGNNYAKGIRNTGDRLTHGGVLSSINSNYTLWTSDRMSVFVMVDTQQNGYSNTDFTPLFDDIRAGDIQFPAFDLF